MAARSNACSELTRFWLEARHGCLVTEGVPVPVPYGLSDIDLVAMHPENRQITLPGGVTLGPRIIVETKDEHDFDPSGREFGKLLQNDAAMLTELPFIAIGNKNVKFSMLREQHYRRAEALFGTDDFDRLFVVHAVDRAVVDELGSTLAPRRIHWLTISELVRDLLGWYRVHAKPTSLRNTLIGDVWHLLVGYCGLDLQDKPL
jgi:hypothetical protein